MELFACRIHSSTVTMLVCDACYGCGEKVLRCSLLVETLIL